MDCWTSPFESLTRDRKKAKQLLRNAITTRNMVSPNPVASHGTTPPQRKIIEEHSPATLSNPPPHSPSSILVLCEGNVCRSPIAEAFLKKSLGPEWRIASAGLGALVGQGVDPELCQMTAEYGVDIATHRGKQLDPAQMQASDLVFALDKDIYKECISLYPMTRGRVFLLGHWLGADRSEVADPYRRGPAVMRATVEHIHQAVQAWLPHLSFIVRT